MFGLAVTRINIGHGQDAYHISLKQLSLMIKVEIIEVLTFVISTMLTKISICLFLLRIFMTNRVWKKVMFIFIALITVTNTSSAIAIFLQCKSAAKLWDPSIEGTCWPQKTRVGLYYYQGGKTAKRYTLFDKSYSWLFIKGTAIFTDFLLASLPIYFLKDIQISFRTKLSLCALMSLGAL